MPTFCTTESTSAILLAAGLSQRMGRPKALLPFGDGVLIQHLIKTFLRILPPENILIVTGHAHKEVESAIQSFRVRSVFNPNFLTGGMLSSVQAGIAAVRDSTSRSFIALGDQPLVQVDTLRQLLVRAANAPLACPAYLGKRGHPLLIRADMYSHVLSLSSSQTLRDFVQQHPPTVIETDDAGVVTDIDTPADYRRVLLQQHHRSEPCTSLVEIS